MRRILGPDADAASAAREMFGWYGRYWAELFWVTSHRRSEIVDHTRVTGLDIWESTQETGRGVIFALPHTGNWEAAGARAEAEGGRVLAVAEALWNRRVVDWFISVRNALGIDVVIAEKGTNVTRALIEQLRAGGVVALLCDRDLKGTGVPVRFFGEETTMPAGPLALADRTNSIVLPIGTYFLEGRGHHLVVDEPLEVPDLPTREERIVAGTQLLAERLEAIIRVDPPQWHVLQPVWPSDRAGE
jgi:KDO2-lipid IV(A) lauroyltransferase